MSRYRKHPPLGGAWKVRAKIVKLNFSRFLLIDSDI
jgi:hypothetical protein